MIYQCKGCGNTTFEIVCPSCGPAEEVHPAGAVSAQLIPLDPSFYPDFQYRSKGLLKDLWGKKKEQAQLSELLERVLNKYTKLKNPYFVNFIHTAKDDGAESSGSSGALIGGEYSDRQLFREVLIRKGFNELESLPAILDKLLLTTEFGAAYAGFSREVSRHVKPDLEQLLLSWIEESGTTFRSDISLLLYYLWDSGVRFPEVVFNPEAATNVGIPLVSLSGVNEVLLRCECLYFDMKTSRLAARLENFDPRRYITMYYVDAMGGFEFEAFLVELFQTIGYDVKETKKTGDQGADLFVSRFGKTTVIQVKNYLGTVGNSAVQQAIAAKAFYGCDDAMVVTNSYFTKSAFELAESASVRLVDRNELKDYLEEYNHKLIETFDLEDGDPELEMNIELDEDFADTET